MDDNRSEEAKEQETMNVFFDILKAQAMSYHIWTGMLPNLLVINPEIIGKLSRIKGFYERDELRALVPAHSPVVRYMRLVWDGNEIILTLIDDWDETFYHFE